MNENYTILDYNLWDVYLRFISIVATHITIKNLKRKLNCLNLE